jgi:hypothetical protein
MADTTTVAVFTDCMKTSFLKCSALPAQCRVERGDVTNLLGLRLGL